MTSQRVLVTGIAGVFGLGLLNLLCAYEMGFFLFYYLPVAFVAWHCGVIRGYLMAGLCTIIWSLAEYHGGRPYSSLFYFWWNAGMRLLAFVFVAMALSAIQHLLTEARAEVASLRNFLRICAWCRKIASPDGQWISIETFFEKHTQSDVTHSICPECAKHAVDDLQRDKTEPYPAGLRQT